MIPFLLVPPARIWKPCRTPASWIFQTQLARTGSLSNRLGLAFRGAVFVEIKVAAVDPHDSLPRGLCEQQEGVCLEMVRSPFSVVYGSFGTPRPRRRTPTGTLNVSFQRYLRRMERRGFEHSASRVRF